MSLMNHRNRCRRGAAGAAIAVTALVLGGCGRMDDHPTIVGVVSPEALAAVPVTATVNTPAQTRGVQTPGTLTPGVQTAGVQTPDTAAPTGVPKLPEAATTTTYGAPPGAQGGTAGGR